MTNATRVFIAVVFLVGVASGSWLSPSLSGQTRRSATPTNLKSVDLGGFCEGKEATVQLYEFGPGTSDKHYHPAHSFAYVLEGSETQIASGRPPVTVKAGEVLYDGPGEIHETTNSLPAKVVIFRIAEKGKDVTTYVP